MVAPAAALAPSVESIIARLERLPISRELTVARIVIGSATFFDAYTVLAIAYAMPVLAREWNLTPGQIGAILSAGYLGQFFGALFFGWLAERIGRLNVLLITVVVFTSMDLACLFAWDATSMMAFRFVQGIGTGGEVPVASAYMNEFVSAKRRGRFFLLYEVLFLFGLLSAGTHRLFSRAYLWLAGDVCRWPRAGHPHNSDAMVHGGIAALVADRRSCPAGERYRRSDGKWPDSAWDYPGASKCRRPPPRQSEIGHTRTL